MKTVALIVLLSCLVGSVEAQAGVVFFSEPDCVGAKLSRNGGQIAFLDRVQATYPKNDGDFDERIQSVRLGTFLGMGTEKGIEGALADLGREFKPKRVITGVELFEDPDFEGNSEYVVPTFDCFNLRDVAGRASSLKIYRRDN